MADDRTRYQRGPQFKATPEEWDAAAENVVLRMLDVEHAVTKREIEARGSDRVWDTHIWSKPIDPAHFTNALNSLRTKGEIESTSALTRGGATVRTWSRPPTRGLKGLIEDAAARKRLLTAHMVQGICGDINDNSQFWDATTHVNGGVAWVNEGSILCMGVATSGRSSFDVVQGDCGVTPSQTWTVV